jgi:hypothetical protein
MTSRTTTLRTTAMTARTTGEDDDDSKDDNSEDDGNSEDDSDVGEDDNNDGGNDDSGGGGGGGGDIGEQVGGVARSVAWLVAMFFAVGCLAFTYRVGIEKIHLRINLGTTGHTPLTRGTFLLPT